MTQPSPASSDARTVRTPVVQLSIVGRITGAAMAVFSADLDRALAAPDDFAVVFDRRLMSAPTPDGREALDRMATELMPRLAVRCLAWADVYDERRARSLQRADADGAHPLPYPHRVFDDVADATRWVQDVTLNSQPGPPDRTES